MIDCLNRLTMTQGTYPPCENPGLEQHRTTQNIHADPYREPTWTFELVRAVVTELDSTIHGIRMLDFYEPNLEVIPTEMQLEALRIIEALLTNCPETLDVFTENTEKMQRFMPSWESVAPAEQGGLKPYSQLRFEKNDITALEVL